MCAGQRQRGAGAHVLTSGSHRTVSARRSTNEASVLHAVAKAEDSAVSCCLSWAGASASWLGSHVWKIDVIFIAMHAS